MITAELTRKPEGTLTRRLKASVAWGTVLSGAAARARRRHLASLRVVMYHGVVPRVDAPAAFGDLFISADMFARQMRHLKRAYQVVSLGELIDCLETGRLFPDRAVLITFDDGYRNTITAALPVLRDLQLPATVFVAPACIDAGALLWFDALRLLINTQTAGNPERAFLMSLRRMRALPPDQFMAEQQRIFEACRAEGLPERYPEFGLADWDEWREALASGLMTVGSHGLTHTDLTRCSNEELMHDVRESKRSIEQHLSSACRALAYPYGAWNDRAAEAVRQAGFACALSTDDGMNRVEDRRFALRRTMIGDKGSFSLFCARVSGAWDQLRSGRDHAARV